MILFQGGFHHDLSLLLPLLHQVNQVLARVDAEFGVDAFGMGGSGFFGDNQCVANVGHRAALCKQSKHFGFARGEVVSSC